MLGIKSFDHMVLDLWTGPDYKLFATDAVVFEDAFAKMLAEDFSHLFKNIRHLGLALGNAPALSPSATLTKVINYATDFKNLAPEKQKKRVTLLCPDLETYHLLRNILDTLISEESYSFKDHSHYRTGGQAAKLLRPTTIEELSIALKKSPLKKGQFFIMGAGSNSLVSDDYWQGSALVLDKLKFIAILPENKIEVGAGVSNNELCKFAYENNLSGLGWMNGLPGLVGGTVRMNARCYGGEIGQQCVQVTSVTLDGNIICHSQENGGPGSSSPKQNPIFKGYKDTIFMTNQQIIAAAVFQLEECKDKKALKQKMTDCISDRQKKGQFKYPSCGCVFKNDYRPQVSLSSGLLLDRAGCKDLKLGGARVSPGHKNFIFNYKNATSRDILELSFLMREKVWQEFGVWLEYEMEVLGSLPTDLASKFFEKRTDEFKVEKLNQARER